jgi:hypothetical protein
VLKETDQLSVPLAAAYAPLSTFVSTFATPRLSDAVPTTATVPLTVAPVDGDVMATDGFCLSFGAAYAALLARAGSTDTANATAKTRLHLAMLT